LRGIARQDLPHTPDAEAPNRLLLPTWLLRVPRRRVLLYPQPEIPQQVMRLIPTRVELQLIVSVTALVQPLILRWPEPTVPGSGGPYRVRVDGSTSNGIAGALPPTSISIDASTTYSHLNPRTITNQSLRLLARSVSG
jgi:hypothetical protein